MKTLIYIILFFAAGIIYYSCKPDQPVEMLKSANDYYPLATGKYIIYAVDSIQYHETTDHDTSHTMVKELLVDTFYDNEQRLNYKIERYTKANDSLEWILTNVWSVLSVDDQIQKVENNLRFIKLSSPVRDGNNWEGNIFLGGLEDLPYDEECNILTFLEDWEYEYANVDQSYAVNGFNFDKTIKVIQRGDSNVIWFDYAEEIYAFGIGMIQKDFFHYYTQDITCIECPWEERVQCGYSVRMKILEWN